MRFFNTSSSADLQRKKLLTSPRDNGKIDGSSKKMISIRFLLKNDVKFPPEGFLYPWLQEK
jgi:hypothetical protein